MMRLLLTRVSGLNNTGRAALLLEKHLSFKVGGFSNSSCFSKIVWKSCMIFSWFCIFEVATTKRDPRILLLQYTMKATKILAANSKWKNVNRVRQILFLQTWRVFSSFLLFYAGQVKLKYTNVSPVFCKSCKFVSDIAEYRTYHH